MNLRFKTGDGENKFPHILNGSGTGAGAMFVALIENAPSRRMARKDSRAIAALPENGPYPRLVKGLAHKMTNKRSAND